MILHRLHWIFNRYMAPAAGDGAVDGTGTTGYSKDELSALSPDELAALEADDGGADETVNKLASESEADAAAVAAAAATAAETAAAAKTAEPGADPEDPGAGPLYTAEGSKDAEGETAAIKALVKTARAEEKAALKQLNDGEIEFEAYEAIKDKSDAAVDDANDKLRALDKQVAKAEVSAEMTEQQIARDWQAECAKLVKTAKAEGLDYTGDEKLRTEFNTLVKVFGMEASASGKTDSKGLEASRWALDQAHTVMKVRHGKGAAAPGADPAPAAQRHNLKSLSGLPAADRNEIEGDAFSKLGGLEGEELELAMANMSPKDVERYLASHDR